MPRYIDEKKIEEAVSNKIQRIQELRRSSATSPHITKGITDRKAVELNIEENEDEHPGYDVVVTFGVAADDPVEAEYIITEYLRNVAGGFYWQIETIRESVL